MHSVPTIHFIQRNRHTVIISQKNAIQLGHVQSWDKLTEAPVNTKCPAFIGLQHKMVLDAIKSSFFVKGFGKFGASVSFQVYHYIHPIANHLSASKRPKSLLHLDCEVNNQLTINLHSWTQKYIQVLEVLPLSAIPTLSRNMATQLVQLPEVERLSASVVRILGGNPGKVSDGYYDVTSSRQVDQ